MKTALASEMATRIQTVEYAFNKNHVSSELRPSTSPARQTYDKRYPSCRLIVAKHIINILTRAARICARQ